MNRYNTILEPPVRGDTKMRHPIEEVEHEEEVVVSDTRKQFQQPVVDNGG